MEPVFAEILWLVDWYDEEGDPNARKRVLSLGRSPLRSSVGAPRWMRWEPRGAAKGWLARVDAGPRARRAALVAAGPLYARRVAASLDLAAVFASVPLPEEISFLIVYLALWAEPPE